MGGDVGRSRAATGNQPGGRWDLELSGSDSVSQLLVRERTNQHDGIHVDLGQRRHGRRNCERKLRSKELRRRSRRHGEPRCRVTGSTLGALRRRTRALDLLQQHLCRSVRGVTKGRSEFSQSMTHTVGIWAGLRLHRWHLCSSVRTGPLNSPAHRQPPRFCRVCQFATVMVMPGPVALSPSGG